MAGRAHQKAGRAVERPDNLRDPLINQPGPSNRPQHQRGIQHERRQHGHLAHRRGAHLDAPDHRKIPLTPTPLRRGFLLPTKPVLAQRRRCVLQGIPSALDASNALMLVEATAEAGCAEKRFDLRGLFLEHQSWGKPHGG